MSIYIITKRDKILTVAERWRETYSDDSIWANDANKQSISKKLNELNLSTCSAQEIDKIIGNDSWTKLDCQECEKDVDKVIHIGNDEEFYGPVVLLCKDCLKEVNKIFNEDGKQ